MYRYEVGDLYKALAERLFAAQRAARAAGGANNIQEKGRGPEQAVRELIQNMIGRSYRVTHGHVVRADQRKSKQIDVIVVRDSPAATMYRSDYDGAELVRAEWVAAVGEVKSSWTKTKDVLDSYGALVSDIQMLQNDLRTKNSNRFGELNDEATMADMVRPTTGREWLNGCYTFLVVLEMNSCPAGQLVSELQRRKIAPDDNAILVLDERAGGVMCVPGCIQGDTMPVGVAQMWMADNEDSVKDREWLVVTSTSGVAKGHRAGALLGWLVCDLQLHLSTWYGEYSNPLHYNALGGRLSRIRQADVGT